MGLGLMQGRFERPRIDRDQQVTLFYVLALAEMNLGDLAVDLRLHRNARVGLNRADGVELQGDGLAHDLSNQHRDGAPHEAAGGVGLGLRASGAERDGENDCGPDPNDAVGAIVHSIGGEAMRNTRDRRDRHGRPAWQAMYVKLPLSSLRSSLSSETSRHNGRSGITRSCVPQPQSLSAKSCRPNLIRVTQGGENRRSRLVAPIRPRSSLARAPVA